MKTYQKRDQNSVATALFNQGKFQRAAKIFESRLSSEARDTVALFHLALSLYNLGQYKRSLIYWKRLHKIAPKEQNLLLNIGCTHQNLGRSDLAIRFFKGEIKRNPKSGEALYSLGTLYYNRHQYKNAAGYLERCYSMKHSVDQIIDRLADSYFRTRQLEKEIALYEDWLLEHPKDTWSLNNLGAALMQKGEFNRAELYLRKALSLDPADRKVLRNITKSRLCRRKINMGSSGDGKSGTPDALSLQLAKRKYAKNGL